MTSEYDILAHLDQTNRPTGDYLNLGQPGDLANCRTCRSRVMYGMPLDGDAGGWMHVRSLDPDTLAPIHLRPPRLTRSGHPGGHPMTTHQPPPPPPSKPADQPKPQPTTASHGVGVGFPRVAGRCPACRGSSLFLAEAGHVTCSRLDCPDPCAADDLLHADQPEPDEPVADVLAAFERGPHGVTAPPPPRVEASGVKLDEPSGQRTAAAAAQDLGRYAGALDARSTQLYDALAERDRQRSDSVRRLRAELATTRGAAAAAGAGWDREAAELARRDAELAEAVEANHRWAADHAEQAAELATARRAADLWERAAGDMEARDRHAAAAALVFGAGLASRWSQTELAGDLCRIAAEIRAGTRSIGDVR
jgi:hypothetical protein